MNSPTDWDELRRRIEAAQKMLTGAEAAAPVDEQRILHERAEILAREPKAATPPRAMIEVVEFELGGERYGIRLARVSEVCALRELTPVPCTPAFVLGIINLRGEIHTIIDLRKFFDLPETGITELNHILIVNDPAMRLGILADAIRGVRTIAVDELQPSLPARTGVRADYVRGVTGDGLVVLDVARILGDERIVVSEEVAD